MTDETSETTIQSVAYDPGLRCAPSGLRASPVFFSLAPLLRGRDERSSLLEGWGEGRLLSACADDEVGPVPLTRRYAPTSPRRRGEVRSRPTPSRPAAP